MTAGKENAFGIWTQKANVGGGLREGGFGFSIGNYGYIGGGNGSLDFWRYDPSTNSWTQESNVPVSIFLGTGFSLLGKGYALLGASYSTTLYQYDPGLNTWVPKAPFPGIARYGPASFGIGNFGYVGGCGVGAGYIQYNDFYQYDPATDTWAAKASFPGELRYSPAGISDNVNGYFGLGLDYFITQLRDWWKYNPIANTWTQLTNFPGIKSNYPSGFCLGNKIYVGIGNDSVSLSVSDFWVYSIPTDSWCQVEDYGGGSRWLAVGFSIGNYGYVGTGNDRNTGQDKNDFWAFRDSLSATINANPLNICLGDSIAFTSTTFGATTYLWNFGDGNTSILANPYHTYLTAGTFTVKFYFASSDCSNDSASLTVTVSTSSIASFTPVITPCSLTVSFTNTSTGAAAYGWNFGDGGTSVLGNPSHTYTASGTYQVTLITGTGSCADTAIQSITISAGSVVVNLGPDVNVCSGQAVTLNAGNPGVTYLWSNGATTQVIVVNIPGQYIVVVSNGNCIGSDTVNISFGVGPVINLASSMKFCSEVDTILDAGNPGMNFLWSTGATTQTISINYPGFYFVRVINGGCTATDTISIGIYPPLLVNLANDTSICPGAQLTLRANAGNRAASYSWIPGGEHTNFIIVNDPGTYSVHIADIYGCITNRTILVREFCYTDLFIPSAFTPNGDAFNGQFLAFGNSILEFHMYVFDRWGELLFESKDISKGWDGTYMDNDCQQGTYVYMVDYKLYDYYELQRHTRYGVVNLLR